MQFVRLDQVFGLPACAIDLLVERLGHARQIGDKEASVGPLGPGLDAGDDAVLDGPAFRGVAEITVTADLFSLAGDAAEDGVLLEHADLSQQHRVAGQVVEPGGQPLPFRSSTPTSAAPATIIDLAGDSLRRTRPRPAVQD